MATVDMHRKFGEVWQEVFKIREQTYRHTLLEMWMVCTIERYFT